MYKKVLLKNQPPTGLTGEYLQFANMAVIIPNTRILAVHGDLTQYNIGCSPRMTTENGIIEDVHKWVDDYNGWFQKQIKDWADYEITHMTEPAFSKLDDISLPLLNQPKSIMVADMLDSDKQYSELPHSVSNYLHKNNIQVVLTGHQICGDHPAILRAGNAVFINGNTGHDPRGDACHTLEIKATPTQAEISIQATLSDKTPTNTHLTITENAIIGDPYVGHVLPNHSLVQCGLPNGNYRLLNLKGRETQYLTISASEIQKLLVTHKSAYVL